MKKTVPNCYGCKAHEGETVQVFLTVAPNGKRVCTRCHSIVMTELYTKLLEKYEVDVAYLTTVINSLEARIKDHDD